ncbi:MAG: NPCBM/NEW2 domain-containing protein [Verrucomicrobiota bacterium]
MASLPPLLKLALFTASLPFLVTAISATESEDRTEVTGPATVEGRRVYLRKELASEIETFHQIAQDKAWTGKPMRLNGKVYETGLGVHADSRIAFPLHRQFATFTVVAGPDEGHHGRLEMKILVDGEERWSSGPVRGHDGNHRRRLTISVKDAERLTLVVDQSDGNQGGDHANWANAYLERYPKRKASTDVEAKTLASVRPQLEPFLNTYCVRCHGPKRQKGQVRFDNVSWEIANNDVAQRWQDVLDQLNGGDMPPVDAKLPSDDDLSLVLDALTGAVIEARQRLTSHGGEIKMRRLNRREYAGTIRALFGFDVALHEIPEDGEIASFDTVGAEQFFTSAHFEKYLQLGRRVMETAFVYNTQPYREAKAERKQPEKGVEQKLRERVADFDRKMEMKVAGASWQEMGFPDEGAAKILFSQFDTRAGHGRRYLELPHFRDGAYLTDSVWAVKRVTASRHVDLRGDYLIRIRGGVVGDPDELRKVLKLTGGDGLMGTLKLSGTPDQPKTFEIATRSRMGRRQLSVQLNENMPTYTANSTRGYRQKLQGKEGVWDPWASLWVDWIEIDGPFYPEKRPRFEEILYPNEPTGGKSPYLWHDEQASELIETFTYEAFRRRVPEPEYLHGLVALYHEHRKSGMKAREAYAEVFAIVLASPGFLFLQEPQPSRSQEGGIDALELANRLSYFLWSAPPDDELFALAKEGEIIRPEILERQLERMLADPKVEAFRAETGNPLIARDDDTVKAIAADTPLDLDRPVFDLDDTASIADFILAEVGL